MSDPVADLLDLDRLRATPLARDPYDHIVAPGFVRLSAVPTINADYPKIADPGSFPLRDLAYGPAFKRLVEAMCDERVRAAFGDKFKVDLSRRPIMITARGRCRVTDGKIHTDSTDKIVTVLIYMNEDWSDPNGRLRILRCGDDLDDYAAEAPPLAGTVLAFRRSERSFHGHTPFEGERRALQVNWVSSRRYVWREQARHRVSAFAKRLRGAA